jgi:hypothetical protein
MSKLEKQSDEAFANDLDYQTYIEDSKLLNCIIDRKINSRITSYPLDHYAIDRFKIEVNLDFSIPKTLSTRQMITLKELLTDCIKNMTSNLFSLTDKPNSEE